MFRRKSTALALVSHTVRFTLTSSRYEPSYAVLLSGRAQCCQSSCQNCLNLAIIFKFVPAKISLQCCKNNNRSTTSCGVITVSLSVCLSVCLSVMTEIALKADSHITCLALSVPLPCHAGKGLECVFPIWFTQCSTEFHEVVIRRIPISVAGGQCETKHRLHEGRKEW